MNADLMDQGGWFSVHRTPQLSHLIASDHTALALLMQIAYRARWSEGWNPHNLKVGEALIGDHRSIGLTRGKYREALARLVKYGIATTRTTSKGTVVMLTGNTLTVSDNHRNSHQDSQPATIEQPSNSHQATTNEEGNTGRRKERKTKRAEIEYPEDFLAIYDRHPKKDAKEPAAKGYAKLSEEDRARLRRYLDRMYGTQGWMKDRGLYVPLLRTIINERLFKDEPATEPERPKDFVGIPDWL